MSDVIRKKNRSKYVILAAVLCGLVSAGSIFAAVYYYLQLVPVWCSARELDAYTILQESDLVEIKQPLMYSMDRIKDKNLLLNRAVKTIIPANQPITMNMLAPTGSGSLLAARITDLKDPGLRAYSLPVDALTACGGEITAGDYVDIVGAIAVGTDTSGGKQYVSKIIAPHVRVIKPLGQGSSIAGIAVALKPQQIQEIQFALMAGKMSLALYPYVADVQASITDKTTNDTFIRKYINSNEGQSDIKDNSK